MFYSPWKTCRRPLESIFGFTHDKTRWSFIFPRQKMHAHHGVCIAWDCNVGFGTIVAACKTSISCFSHDLPRIRGCLVPWPSRFPFGLVPFFSPPFVQFSLPTLVGLSLPPDPSCRDISCLAHLRPFLLSHCFVPRSSVLPVGRRRVVCALIFDVRVWVWIFPPFFLSLSPIGFRFGFAGWVRARSPFLRFPVVDRFCPVERKGRLGKLRFIGSGLGSILAHLPWKRPISTCLVWSRWRTTQRKGAAWPTSSNATMGASVCPGASTSSERWTADPSPWKKRTSSKNAYKPNRTCCESTRRGIERERQGRKNMS